MIFKKKIVSYYNKYKCKDGYKYTVLGVWCIFKASSKNCIVINSFTLFIIKLYLLKLLFQTSQFIFLLLQPV